MGTMPVCPADVALYSFDEEAHNQLLHSFQQHHQRLRLDPPTGRVQSPVAFTDVWISDLALSKMMAHAESGGKIEVMGLLLGKAVVCSQGSAASTTNYGSILASSEQEGCIEEQPEGKTGYFVVTDCFALPVEGTETRVNAAEEANEFMIEFLEATEKIPTAQKVVGWYHSHPNYGCWLSGIDVRTQQLQQQHQDPFLAIVVDPIRTLSNGRIELGAFRTFLPGEENSAEGEGDAASQLLPAEKVHDFGVHWQQYYQLRTHFCSNSITTHLLEEMGSASWPDVLVGRSLTRNRSLELRRLEAVVEACRGAGNTLHSSHPMTSSDDGGHGIKGNYDSFDPMLPPEYSEKLGFAQAKPLQQRLAGAADQAGEVTIHALMSLVETAALTVKVPSAFRDSRTTAVLQTVCGNFWLMQSSIYHGSATWTEHLQSVD